MTQAWHPLLQLLVVMLAAARITVLLVDDEILAKPRGYLLARVQGQHELETLLECQRCMGWWVSLIGTVLWFHWPAGVTVLSTPWAVAMLAWWAGASWIPDPDETNVYVGRRRVMKYPPGEGECLGGGLPPQGDEVELEVSRQE